MSASGKKFAHNLNILHNFTRKVIRDRKHEIISGKGDDVSETADDPSGTQNQSRFLDLLLHHHLDGPDLTEEGIREEVDTFMFEGHDTTSMALSWIIFLLGHHPEIQEKVWSEIDSLFEELEGELTDGQRVQIPLHRVKDLK